MKQLFQRFQSLPLTARLCIIMSFIFLLSLIPMLHIALYAHPAGDDFAYGLRAHLAWEETRSLFATLKAAAENVRNYYQTWQGTYSSIFLMSLQPTVISERLYPLTAVIMLGMLICSHFFLFYTIFTRYLKLARSLWVSLCLAVLFLSTQILDAASEAFFWFNGAVHYVFMHSCMIFLISVLLLYFRLSKKRSKIFCLLASCFLGFVIGGSNFVTALLSPILMTALLFLFVLRRERQAYVIAFPLMVTLVGLFINVSAPGNSIRLSTQIDSMNAVEAIYYSFVYAVESIGTWSTVYVLFFVVLLLPFLIKALYHTDFTFPLPGLVAAFSFCIIAASHTPSLYSMGHVIIFDRTRNIMRMLFYLLTFLNLVYVTGWLVSRCKAYAKEDSLPALIHQFRKQFLRSFCTGMTVFFLSLLVFCDKNKITSLSAVDSVVSGYAQSYHEETLHRISLLSMEGVDEVWVPNYTVRPPLLNLQDISTDPSDYRNQSVASWYGKTTLHLSEIY